MSAIGITDQSTFLLRIRKLHGRELRIRDGLLLYRRERRKAKGLECPLDENMAYTVHGCVNERHRRLGVRRPDYCFSLIAQEDVDE